MTDYPYDLNEIIDRIRNLYNGIGVMPDRKSAIALCELVPEWSSQYAAAAYFLGLAHSEGAILDYDLDKAIHLMEKAASSDKLWIAELAAEWLRYNKRKYSLQTCYECGLQLPANLMTAGDLVTQEVVDETNTTKTIFVPEVKSYTSSSSSYSGSSSTLYGGEHYYDNRHGVSRGSSNTSYRGGSYSRTTTSTPSFSIKERTSSRSQSSHISKQWLCNDCLTGYLSEDTLLSMAVDGDVRAIEYFRNKNTLDKNIGLALYEKFPWALEFCVIYLPEKRIIELALDGNATAIDYFQTYKFVSDDALKVLAAKYEWAMERIENNRRLKEERDRREKEAVTQARTIRGVFIVGAGIISSILWFGYQFNFAYYMLFISLYFLIDLFSTSLAESLSENDITLTNNVISSVISLAVFASLWLYFRDKFSGYVLIVSLCMALYYPTILVLFGKDRLADNSFRNSIRALFFIVGTLVYYYLPDAGVIPYISNDQKSAGYNGGASYNQSMPGAGLDESGRSTSAPSKPRGNLPKSTLPPADEVIEKPSSELNENIDSRVSTVNNFRKSVDKSKGLDNKNNKRNISKTKPKNPENMEDSSGDPEYDREMQVIKRHQQWQEKAVECYNRTQRMDCWTNGQKQ